jgi:hypothetical protein
MTETPRGRRGHREARRTQARQTRARGRLREALSEAPVWVKQASAFIVGVAGVAVAVATIIGLLRSSPPATLDVKLGRPQWAAHDLTLGSYLAWQQRESATLGLRAGGESAAAEFGGGTARSEAKSIVLDLARYVSAGPGMEAQVKTPDTTADTPVTPTSDTTPETDKPGTNGTSAGSGPTSSTPKSGSETNTPSPSTGTDNEYNSPEPAGGNAGKSEAKAGSLGSQALQEARSRLNSADTSRLEQKASEQEAIIKEAGVGSGPELTRMCQGAGYGGCSPEAAGESTTSPPIGATPPPTGASPPGEEKAGSAPPGESTTSAPSSGLGQRQRELLEIAEGARLGRATNVDLIPPLMTAGLSAAQRARVAAVLGDAVSFDVHTHGWIGQQLWLTWTMYEKQDGYWNPSSRVYLIDHAEAYLVPAATEDEGVLTFWFPIPKQRGDYQVRYFIRAPGTGKKLVEGKSPSFRS